MPIHQIHWVWDEAFDKFGFDDGDGWNGTCLVERFLLDIGCKEIKCDVWCDVWEIHNYMIFQIVDKDGNKYEFNGNENPRDILPKYIIEKLNNKFCD